MIIIHPDNKMKSLFDVFILFLVAYSCISNMLFVSFRDKNHVQTDSELLTYWVVEYFFYLDFILNFFQGFKDPDTLENIFDIK